MKPLACLALLITILLSLVAGGRFGAWYALEFHCKPTTQTTYF